MGGRHREVFLEEAVLGLGQIPQLEERQHRECQVQRGIPWSSVAEHTDVAHGLPTPPCSK